jgi:hypothetical protein
MQTQLIGPNKTNDTKSIDVSKLKQFLPEFIECVRPTVTEKCGTVPLSVLSAFAAATDADRCAIDINQGTYARACLRTQERVFAVFGTASNVSSPQSSTPPSSVPKPTTCSDQQGTCFQKNLATMNFVPGALLFEYSPSTMCANVKLYHDCVSQLSCEAPTQAQVECSTNACLYIGAVPADLLGRLVRRARERRLR